MNALKNWFFLNRRLLPWREDPTPYEVWVSEIMLQQTQVSVVIPYFNRWMQKFPTIESLAQGSIDQVIKIWEGLGYYSRARNLYEGACYVMKVHGGKLPNTQDELKKIKGLGPYTVGAILSFAFKQKAVAVDGNVLRVLARYFCFNEEIDKAKTRKLFEERLGKILPRREPFIAMEALIELGALVCQKTPKCSVCPLKETCLAFKEGRHLELPIKSKRAKIENLHRMVAIIQSEQKVLVRKGEKGKVMADLWEFPYFEVEKEEKPVKMREIIIESLKIKPSYAQPLPQISHGFTRYRAFLYPHIWNVTTPLSVKGYTWISIEEIQLKPFSSGHRRLLDFF